MNKLKKYSNSSILISGICTLSLAMGISRFVFTTIIPLMRRDFGISEWNIAILTSANYLGYLMRDNASEKVDYKICTSLVSYCDIE